MGDNKTKEATKAMANEDKSKATTTARKPIQENTETTEVNTIKKQLRKEPRKLPQRKRNREEDMEESNNKKQASKPPRPKKLPKKRKKEEVVDEEEEPILEEDPKYKEYYNWGTAARECPGLGDCMCPERSNPDPQIDKSLCQQCHWRPHWGCLHLQSGICIRCITCAAGLACKAPDKAILVGTTDAKLFTKCSTCQRNVHRTCGQTTDTEKGLVICFSCSDGRLEYQCCAETMCMEDEDEEDPITLVHNQAYLCWKCKQYCHAFGCLVTKKGICVQCDTVNDEEEKEESNPNKAASTAGTTGPVLEDSFIEWRARYGFYDKKIFNKLKDVYSPAGEKEYVRTSLKQWKWHSDEEHDAWIEKKEAEILAATTNKQKSLITCQVKETKTIRLKYIRQLKNEYKASRPSWVRGLRPNGNPPEDYTALVVYKKKILKPGNIVKNNLTPSAVSAIEEFEETTRLPSAWVKRNYSPDYLRQLQDRHDRLDNKGFYMVTEDKIVLLKKKVHKVKYVHPRETLVIDHELWNQEKAEKAAYEEAMQLYEQSNGAMEKPVKPVIPDGKPEMVRTIPGRFVALNEEGEKMDATVEDLEADFGKLFVEEIKRLRKGFWDVPVGDHRESTIHLYPHLSQPDAPCVKFQQTEGIDLCAFKSFASALHSMGFTEEAEVVNDAGVEHGKGTVDGFEYLRKVATETLPRWVQISKTRSNFKWTAELSPQMVFVAVLLASDGNCSHAVTIHRGWLFDANEKYAIPMCKEALDYCTCDETQTSTFVQFHKGWLLQYTGKKQEKISRFRQLEAPKRNNRR